MKTQYINGKEAIKIYARSLQIQDNLIAKALAAPSYTLSFEESVQYLESLRKEQRAQRHIRELFAQQEI